MITLKECFQYSKYISNLMVEVQRYLVDHSYTMNIVEHHIKSKSNKDGIDEDIKINNDFLPNISPDDLVVVLENFTDELERVTTAIYEIKEDTNFDTLIFMNSKKREKLETYQAMLNCKNTNVTKIGTAFTYNVEGNQVPYKYNIDVESTINYDKEKLRSIVKKLRKETENISLRIDEIQLMKTDFVPTYSIGDSLEEIIEQYDFY